MCPKDVLEIQQKPVAQNNAVQHVCNGEDNRKRPSCSIVGDRLREFSHHPFSGSTAWLWMRCSSRVWNNVGKCLHMKKATEHDWHIHCAVLSRFSCVGLFVTLWTVACQAPPSTGFSRQEYWSGLPCPPPGDLPDPGIKPMSLTSPALADGFCTTRATWTAWHIYYMISILLKYK